MIRLTVHYTGRVQGVGFRFTTVNVARQVDVTGYVQNLPDGSVRMVAEGEAPTVRAFADAVKNRFSRNITHADESQCQATGEFKRFEVKH